MAHRGVKEGRIVGRDRHLHTALAQALDRVAGPVGIDPEHDVGAGTDLQRHARLGQFVHQCRILDRAHTVTDALHTEIAQGIAHRLRPAPLPGMGGQAQPGLARQVERPGEIARLALAFIARDAEPGDPVARCFSRAKGRGARLIGAEMSDAGDDAAQDDAVARLCAIRRLLHGVEVFAPRADVRATAEIGRQKRLAIDDALGGAFLQHRADEAGVIVGAFQDRGRGLIDAEEMHEVPVGIASVLLEHAAQVDGFLLGQSADKGGRRGPFEVQMQFEFRQVLQAHDASVGMLR